MRKRKGIKLDGKSVYTRSSKEKVPEWFYPSGGTLNGKTLYFKLKYH